MVRMTVGDWVAETKQKYRTHGTATATKAAVQELWQGALKRAFARLNYRPSVWDRDWDVLVIMDACRVDALRTIVEDDDRFPPGTAVRRVVSPASTSAEFMESQFTNGPSAEKHRAGLVCSNPYAAKCPGVAPNQWQRVEHVWRQYGDTGAIDATPPRPVTDAAITVARETDPERLIVWYMQPHFPARTLNETGVFKKIRDGDITFSRAWDAYIDNARWVLDDIALLRKSIDAERIAITADHGESFGEYGVYGHAPNIPTPQLKTVPWLVVDGTNDTEYTPEHRPMAEAASSVSEQLNALGYT